MTVQQQNEDRGCTIDCMKISSSVWCKVAVILVREKVGNKKLKLFIYLCIYLSIFPFICLPTYFPSNSSMKLSHFSINDYESICTSISYLFLFHSFFFFFPSSCSLSFFSSSPFCFFPSSSSLLFLLPFFLLFLFSFFLIIGLQHTLWYSSLSSLLIAVSFASFAPELPLVADAKKSSAYI